jgi:PAS domain S-box-containing protein
LSGGNIAGSTEQDASPKLATEDPFDLLVDTTLQLDRSNQQRPPVGAELQVALNLIPAFTWCCNASGGLIFLNERGSDYLGLPKDHPVRHGIDTGAEWDSHVALLHPDDHEEARRVWSILLRTGRAGDVSFRVRNAAGGYRWHLSRAEPVRASDGTLLYWIGVNLDIEDRKQAELYLAEGQRLAHTGSWAFNAAGFDYWSPELFRIYGLDPSGKAPTLEEYMELVHPDDREFVAETIQKMFAEHRGFDFTKRIVRPDGEIRHVRCVASHATHAGAVEEFIGTGMDVTEHELLTQELGRREAYLAEAQKLSHTGSFGWKPDTGEIIWSAETYRIFEYDRAVTPTIDLVVQRVHPEDRAGVQSVVERASRGASDLEDAYRLLLPDGRVKHVRALAHATLDECGNREYVGAVTDITEQRRAEESLRESESYLAEAQKLSHTGSWAWGPEKDIRYWSDECYRVLGFDLHAGLPRNEELAQRVHPDDQVELREATRKAIRDKVDVETEYRIVHPSGAVRDIHSTGHPVLGPSGDVIELTGTVIDITDRKIAEEALRSSEAYLAEAQRMSHTGSWANAANGEPKYWSEECYRVLGFDPAEPLPSLETIFQRIHPDDRAAMREQLDRGIREKADFEVDMRIVHPITGIRNIRSICHAVLDGCGDLREMVGTVIDITERKKAEEELRQSETYLAEAQKLSQTGSWAWSRTDGIRYWSDECYRVLGFDPRDGLPRFGEIFQRIHPDDQVRNREVTQRAISEKVDVEFEYRIVHPGGDVRHIHSTCHPVLAPSGDLVELTGTVIDITERKQAEEELRASESKYRHLVDTTPAFVHTALPNGELDFLNRGWLEYVGAPLTDLLGWGWTSKIHPEDVEAFVDRWLASVQSGEPFLAESRVRRADGEYRWFMHHKEPLRNEGGEIIKWYGSSIDIQERKIAEEEIREQEARFRQILDLAPQHIGVFGPDGSPLYVNQVGLEYFGPTVWRADPGQLDANNPWPGSRLDLVHPEDREHFVSERKKGFLEGRPFEHEARLLRHDGQFRCFIIRFAPIKDERGDITRWCGIGTDIEDRKRAEEEIRKENIALREEIIKASMFEEIVGNSPALQQVLVRVAKVAPTDSTAIITGETGTGKELIARAVHKASKRSDRAFVSVNCAAIPASLIPSELFGHEKGAFTGATGRRLGRFELAEGGTIFLDEVGELPSETQIALLRVLQEHEFERVGGNRSIKTNVRVIVATNRDLPAAIAAGTFREDLFYRLNVFPIEIPPLRERSEDIPLLVQYFIDRYARKEGKNVGRVRRETLDLFQRYAWPGNIRELQNVIERSVILSEGESFSVDESWLSQQPLRTSGTSQRELRQRVAAEEKQAIEAALTESGGRVFGPTGAAARLGIARSTLESKIRTLKIDKNRFRPSSGA